MKDARPALRYAKAILNLAVESQLESQVNADMQLIAETISISDELQVVLKSPIIKIKDKNNILNALFSDKVSSITKGLFGLLQDNTRIEMLESIAKQYTIIFDFYKKIKTAKVTTAVALSKDLEIKVQDKIVALTGNKTSIENIINPDILGGFILRIGDVQYDASISNQLKILKKEFDNSHYISKI